MKYGIKDVLNFRFILSGLFLHKLSHHFQNISLRKFAFFNFRVRIRCKVLRRSDTNAIWFIERLWTLSSEDVLNDIFKRMKRGASTVKSILLSIVDGLDPCVDFIVDSTIIGIKFICIEVRCLNQCCTGVC